MEEISDVDKFEEYKIRLRRDAEQLVLEVFPERILKLSELLKNHKLLRSDSTLVHEDLNIPTQNTVSVEEECIHGDTKMMTWQNSIIPSHKLLCDLIDLAKVHVQELQKDLKIIRLWISYMVPKIGDGDNFGVDVQQSILEEVEDAEDVSSGHIKNMGFYFQSRSRIIKKAIRYPFIEDFRVALQHMDEEGHMDIRQVITETHNMYGMLHDIIVKNLDKIKEPKSSSPVRWD